MLAVADEIMQGSELLPKSLDLGFYLEARYVFSSRIIAALITNGLIESVSNYLFYLQLLILLNRCLKANDSS